MSEMTRRKFLGRGAKAAGAVLAGAGATVVPLAGLRLESVQGHAASAATGAQAAILYDSTLCIGCRACELGCNDANELDRSPEEVFEAGEVQDFRALATNAFTRVTQHPDVPGGSSMSFGKVQCMHCLDPACASSCPVSALEKTPEGPVVWHPELCLGCRYCMMACPFMVPRFEWGSVNPRIRKCEMCRPRLLEGEPPACVATCPTGALKFGTREEMLAEAHRRIQENPRGYVHHVFGETEAGGTNVLHVAARPCEELGYPADLPDSSNAQRVRPAMAAIPFVLNGVVLLLGASAWAISRREMAIYRKEEDDR